MSETRKTCPLLGAGPLGVNTNCKEDRCAWWCTKYDPMIGTYDGACALVHIADALNNISKYGISRKENK